MTSLTASQLVSIREAPHIIAGRSTTVPSNRPNDLCRGRNGYDGRNGALSRKCVDHVTRLSVVGLHDVIAARKINCHSLDGLFDG